MNARVVISALTIMACVAAGDSLSAQSDQTGAPPNNRLVLGQTPPGTQPELFASDVIQDGVHSAPALTPDEQEMYWSAYYVPEGKRSRTQHIFYSRMVDGRWSPPELAPFSGVYADGGPFITRDGSRLFFYSNRPAEPGQPATDEYVSDIWVIDRKGTGWGEPVRLPFNSDKHDGMQSVSDNGTVCFQSNRTGSYGIFDVYCAEFDGEDHSAPRNLGRTINCPNMNFSPFIAPDESYLILAYNNNAPNNGLHISFRKADGTWTKPVSLGSEINATSAQRFPGLSRDGRYLFFTRDEGQKRGLYWVDAVVIEHLRKQVLGP